MLKKHMALALVLGCSVVATSVHAHDGATGVIKERMEMMKQLGGVMKSLVPMIKGNVGFDAEVVKQQAQKIQENSGQKLLEKFPEGTVDPVSEARPEIWQNWAAFKEISMNLSAAGKALEMTPTEASLKANFGQIGAACGSCHKQFRIKK